MNALILFLAILAVSLVLSPLFVRQLRAERRRWARDEENRRLAERVGGKLLVRRGCEYDIVDVAEGLIPKGVVYVVTDGWSQEPDLFEPLEHLFPSSLSEAEVRRWVNEYLRLPVVLPSPAFHIGNIS